MLASDAVIDFPEHDISFALPLVAIIDDERALEVHALKSFRQMEPVSDFAPG
jgi:hypothetical protein